MSRIPGAATASTTKPAHLSGPFAARRRPLWPDGPHVSLVGFGSYRIGLNPTLGFPDCEKALEHALTEGCNLIDTSTNYGDGQSELLIGRVIKRLVAAGTVARENLVIVTKVGYVQGQNYELAMARITEGRPFPGMTHFGEHVWHCIHPEFIRDQVDRSQARLGLDTIDVLLLHNPEYMLKHLEASGVELAAARTQFYANLAESFECLESLVAEGRIKAYGVSSNTFGQPEEDPTSVSIATCLAVATAVSDKRGLGPHHFRVVQMPLNWVEVGPVFMPISSVLPESTVTFAEKNGLGVLINRPLNAMVNNGLMRLSRPVVRQPVAELSEQMRKGLENWTRLARDLEGLAHNHLEGTVGYEDAPLSQLVMASLIWQPGVTAVLLGMRRVTYVDDAAEALRRPALLRGRELLSSIYRDLEFQADN